MIDGEKEYMHRLRHYCSLEKVEIPDLKNAKKLSEDLIKKKGGFVHAHWDGTAETEEKIKDASETEFLKVNGSKKNWDKSSYYVDMLSKK